ncbi:MAG: glycosyltransferase family 4 protein, partial [Candidatus Shapirobacteria bacterium]
MLAKIQAKIGLKPSVITSKSNITKTKNEDNFNVTHLKSFSIFNTKIMPGLFLKLLKLGRSDIVHLHISSAFMPELVWLFSKLKGFKYIAHIHLDIMPTSKAGFLLKIYKPLILKHVLRSAGFVVVFTKDQFESVHKKYGVEKSKIQIVPNGVEDKFFFNTPRKLHKKPRLLFVGRLGLQKNIPQLLRALEGVSEQFETIIVGEGNLEADLKELAKDLNLKNITFTGRADGEKLLNYYKQSDFFVLSSEREGMPLVLLEAIAMGLPIVATDVTGNRDVVENDKNGLLVPLNNVKAFQSALLKISHSEKLYSKLSQGASETAKQFSWEKTSEKFENLYKKLITKSENLSIKSRITGFKIWYLFLPLLIIANTSYLLNNIFGSFITLGFFLLVPGFLALNLLDHEMKSRWKIASFSLGLSLFAIMFGGLLLNTLNLLGLKQPLTTQNIFIMLDVVILILLAFNKNKVFNSENFKLKIPSINQTVTTLLLSCLPFLAAGGAISLNNGGSNIFTMISFGLIPLLFLYLIWQKGLKSLYPYAVIMIGLA